MIEGLSRILRESGSRLVRLRGRLPFTLGGNPKTDLERDAAANLARIRRNLDLYHLSSQGLVDPHCVDAQALAGDRAAIESDRRRARKQMGQGSAS